VTGLSGRTEEWFCLLCERLGLDLGRIIARSAFLSRRSQTAEVHFYMVNKRRMPSFTFNVMLPDASWPIIVGAAAGLGCAFFAGKYIGSTQATAHSMPETETAAQPIR
jgi:hypothetical protein